MMRKRSILTLAVTIASISFICFSPSAHADQIRSTGTVDVYFSPNSGATQAVVTELNGARKEILVRAYSFTSALIAKALTDASKNSKIAYRIQVVSLYLPIGYSQYERNQNAEENVFPHGMLHSDASTFGKWI